MSDFPLIFRRRTYENKDRDLLCFVGIRICVTEETDVCFRIEATTFLIDWGDGVSDSRTGHHYEQAGEYAVRIVGTAIHSLDISKCHVMEVNLKKCGWLEHLQCAHNHLRSLELACCPELVSIDCSDNDLAVLQIRGKSRLVGVDCSNNVLQRLEVGHCKNLIYLYAAYNQLTQLDLGDCDKIFCVDIGFNLFDAQGLNRVFASLIRREDMEGAIMLEQARGAERECDIDLLHQKGWQIV